MTASAASMTPITGNEGVGFMSAAFSFRTTRHPPDRVGTDFARTYGLQPGINQFDILVAKLVAIGQIDAVSNPCKMRYGPPESR